MSMTQERGRILRDLECDLSGELLLTDLFGAPANAPTNAPTLAPISAEDRGKNPLRPASLEQVVGQERPKRLMRRLLDAAIANGQPLDHVLLCGPSGTGKTTFATVIANELGVDCYQLEAPVGQETLAELREVAQDGDVVLVDEIHMQASQDRRGAQAAMSPEQFYNVLEDRTLVSGGQVLDFPKVTFIGATTDEGLLPEPFLNRFPLRPHLERYSDEDMTEIAAMNGEVLGLELDPEAAAIFGRASRATPRVVNSYLKNAAGLAVGGIIDEELAREVVIDLNRTSLDGLTADMQALLTFLYTRCKRTRSSDGETTYSASVSTISTSLGKGRDTKAVPLRIEPELIARGYVQVGHGGRALTDAGIVRAQELIA